MSKKSAEPGTSKPESKLREVNGVPVYARTDNRGRPGEVDAIDFDEAKIREIADRCNARATASCGSEVRGQAKSTTC